MILKDDALVALSKDYNVAQFVSFSPGNDPKPRHIVLHGVNDPAAEQSPRSLIGLLLNQTGSVNIRPFRPSQPKGNPFHYGLTTVDSALAVLLQLSNQGYHVIVNETIDVLDGGFSGVILGDVIDFAPAATPRGVEMEGTASLPLDLGMRLVETVYGFRPSWPSSSSHRVEVSVHPKPVGLRRTNELVWEIEEQGWTGLDTTIWWPNVYSNFIGDKAYGLLIANLIQLPVPRTLIVPRRLPPFSFGRDSGRRSTWVRTAPSIPQPGLYSTLSSYRDIFALLNDEDPDGTSIASVLVQQGVDPQWSGAAQALIDGSRIEGIQGDGQAFMLGEQAPESLPRKVTTRVHDVVAQATSNLGPVRLEWVDDGRETWVVQIHRADNPLPAAVFSPGKPQHGWIQFRPAEGLAHLRLLIDEAAARGQGIEVAGAVGLTSHVGDLIRKAGIPGRRATY